MVTVARKRASKSTAGGPAAKKAASKPAVSGMGPEDGKAQAVTASALAPVPTLKQPANKQAAPRKAPTKVKEAPAKEKSPKEKAKKPKLVRDSFAMPESEYEVLRDMKKACMKAGVDIKKSELLRVGVALLKKQTPADIQASLSGLVSLKAGRPKKAA
jgi:hypothetical protein